MVREPELRLWQVAKDTLANSGSMLVKLFEKIKSFFERLKIYTEVPPLAVTEGLVKIMAEVLSILSYCDKIDEGGKIVTSGKTVCDNFDKFSIDFKGHTILPQHQAEHLLVRCEGTKSDG